MTCGAGTAGRILDEYVFRPISRSPTHVLLHKTAPIIVVRELSCLRRLAARRGGAGDSGSCRILSLEEAQPDRRAVPG